MPVIASSASSTASATVSATSAWLKDPLAPASNQAVTVADLSVSHAVRAGVFEPEGRTLAVVASGATYGISGSLRIRVLSKATYDALLALLKSKRTLLLQLVIARQHYLRVTADVGESFIRAQPAVGEPYPVRHAHELTAPVVEVAKP